MSPSNGKDYKLEIELLKKDVSSISNLYERMDNTIEKIETAASDISKIVIQQEQKIKIQEHINRDLETSLERHTRDSEERSRELNSKIECVDDKIDRVNKELTNKIEQTQSTIVSEMMQGRELLKQDPTGVAARKFVDSIAQDQIQGMKSAMGYGQNTGAPSGNVLRFDAKGNPIQ